MSESPLQLVFAGTSDFAAHHLQALINSRHNLCAVYTQPDRPAGRGRTLTASAVKQLALDNHLTLYQPETFSTSAAQQLLSSFKADLMIVVAYGIILPVEILRIPRLGCINVHASLLPRWRGAAPVQRAIEAGDRETGVTIMQMDSGLDTGDMLLSSAIAINANETSQSLHQRLMQTGSTVLLKALDKLIKGKIVPIAQDTTQACYARKLSKEEGAIDWSLSAELLIRKIRAFDPWPGSYVSLKHQKMKIQVAKSNLENNAYNSENSTQGENIKVGTIINADKNGLRVSCASGYLQINALQLPGKKMTAVSALLNAYGDRFRPGQQFDT